jgi:hypothetical protein
MYIVHVYTTCTIACSCSLLFTIANCSKLQLIASTVANYVSYVSYFDCLPPNALVSPPADMFAIGIRSRSYPILPFASRIRLGLGLPWLRNDAVTGPNDSLSKHSALEPVVPL